MRIMAYYGNLMLLSSFLGLSCGVLLSRRTQKLYRWFPPALLLLLLGVFFLWRLGPLFPGFQPNFAWKEFRIGANIRQLTVLPTIDMSDACE